MRPGIYAVFVGCLGLPACSPHEEVDDAGPNFAEDAGSEPDDGGLHLSPPERLVVSAGVDFNCLLRPDGTIECWGDDFHGQVSDVPEGTFAQIDAGMEHACGLRTNGSLACWGTPYGVLQDPPPEGRFVSVSVGYATACALDEAGEITCWGCTRWVCDEPYVESSDGSCEGEIECWVSQDTVHNIDGWEAPLPAGTFTQLDLGRDYGGCALDDAGEIACWGDPQRTSLLSPPAGPFTQLSFGDAHGCALDPYREAVCWGFAPATSDGPFVMLSAGDGAGFGTPSTAALDANGAITIWSKSPSDSPVVTDVPTGVFEQVDLGESHGCVVTADSRIECWGERGGAVPPP